MTCLIKSLRQNHSKTIIYFLEDIYVDITKKTIDTTWIATEVYVVVGSCLPIHQLSISFMFPNTLFFFLPSSPTNIFVPLQHDHVLLGRWVVRFRRTTS